MSNQCEVTGKQAAGAEMSVFERYLTVWVFLCIVAGIALGQFFPGVFQFIGGIEVAQINLPVAVLIWLMIIPMLLKIDLKALAGVREHWRGVGVTLFVNWGGQALLDGAVGLALHRRAVPPLPAGGAGRPLHRRADPPHRRTLHGHGVRLEQPLARRAALHADPAWR